MILNNVRALEFVRDHVGEELTPEFICGVHNTKMKYLLRRAELNNRQTRPSPPGRTAGMKSTLHSAAGSHSTNTHANGRNTTNSNPQPGPQNQARSAWRASPTISRMQFGYPNFLQRPKTLQFQRYDFNV